MYLKLQQYRQKSLKAKKPNKVAVKSYDPFLIVKKTGKVGYHLQLPQTLVPPLPNLEFVVAMAPMKQYSRSNKGKDLLITPIGEDPTTHKPILQVQLPPKMGLIN